MKVAATSERPFPITIICGIGFLFLLFSFHISNSNYFLDDSYAGFTSIVTLASLIGIWSMKKLALYIYFSVFIVNQFVALFLGHWSLQSIFIPIVIIGVASLYHNKMN
ncbi:MAG: hypothetical protein ABIQ27_07295 [Flavobacterium sp.]|uniref:hypothetical protein n=1 Tax=Flavobacterium sp. TaxID=239 RepID=UPI003265F81E